MKLADVQAETWQASGLRLALELSPDGPPSGMLRVERLRAPGVGVFHDLRVRCGRIRLAANGLDCGSAVFSLPGSDSQDTRLHGSLHYDPSASVLNWRIDVRDRGYLRVSAEWGGDEWRVALDGRAVPAAWIAAFVGAFVPATGGVARTGTIDLDVAIGPAADAPELRGTLILRKVGLSARDGRLATQALDAVIRLAVTFSDSGWPFAVEASLLDGQAYVDPVFVDFGRASARLQAEGKWAEPALLSLSRLHWDQPGALEASASLRLDMDDPTPLQRLDASVDALRLPSGYAFFLQPFLIGTPLGDLDSGGAVAGALRVRLGVPVAARVRFKNVYLSDREERFALRALDGTLRWAPADAEPSRLAWDGGALYGVPFRSAGLRFMLEGAGGRLLRPVRVPLLDGALVVQDLAAYALATPDAAVDLRARLEPISLRDLSRALGWPPLVGSASGRLPALHYRGGVLTADGPLLVRLYDGRLTLRHLRVAQPFGLVPRLRADIVLDGLNLKPLTGASEFGVISGHLDGYVRDLRLVGWRPAAFDARVYTLRGDPAPHRISRLAIRNITSLGGGGSAVLSRGLLSYFEDFAYDRMALGCRLRSGVCIMSGLEPTPGGFLIVRGAGLPRVDVVGHNRRVDWSTFVRQLLAAARGGGPVVK